MGGSRFKDTHGSAKRDAPTPASAARRVRAAWPSSLPLADVAALSELSKAASTRLVRDLVRQLPVERIGAAELRRLRELAQVIAVLPDASRIDPQDVKDLRQKYRRQISRLPAEARPALREQTDSALDACSPRASQPPRQGGAIAGPGLRAKHCSPAGPRCCQTSALTTTSGAGQNFVSSAQAGKHRSKKIQVEQVRVEEVEHGEVGLEGLELALEEKLGPALSQHSHL